MNLEDRATILSLVRIAKNWRLKTSTMKRSAWWAELDPEKDLISWTVTTDQSAREHEVRVRLRGRVTPLRLTIHF